MRNLKIIACSTLLAGLLSTPAAIATPGDTIHETCPDIGDAGDVRCYPIHYTAKTEVHPNGLPIVAYLFVPKDLPASGEALPAMVFAHGSGSMFSSGNHNSGLNSKHKQWTRQFTAERGVVSLHVSSFQSRYYMLPDTIGDQRMFDWETPPAADSMGGDDYRATSTAGGQEEGDAFVDAPFDPNAQDWKDQSNGRAGISEIIERPYDLEAGYDYLVGIIDGTTLPNARGETLAAGFTAGITQKINDLVPGLVIDPERVFVYGTSHGGQAIQALAHKPRATAASHPMGNHPRFAAYFNFYGGCGLYGAFGGADSGSTWYPVGPFFSLHGELDGIWQESAEPTTRETWEKGECAPRITNALVNPDMNTLLATVLMADAEHSFSGAAIGDGKDWDAKVYSDYEIVLPLMDSIGWITWARRSSQSVIPSLTDLGFAMENSSFTTLPLAASHPPYDKYTTRANDGVIDAPDLRNLTLDLSSIFAEFSGEGTLSYSLLHNNSPGEVSISGGSNLAVAFSDITLAAQNPGDVVEQLVIRVENDKGGELFKPVKIVFDAGQSGHLQLQQGVRARTNQVQDASLASGNIETDLNGFLTTMFARGSGHPLVFDKVSGFPAGLELDPRGRLAGAVGSLPLTVRIGIISDGLMPLFDLTIAAGIRPDLARLSLTHIGIVEAAASGAVNVPNYADLSISPGMHSSGPIAMDGSTSDWLIVPPDDGSDGDSGGGSGGDSGGDSGGTPGDGGSGGGGALLWLLPAVLLLRRRHLV